MAQKTFLDILKLSRIVPIHKKVHSKISRIIDQYLWYNRFLILLLKLSSSVSTEYFKTPYYLWIYPVIFYCIFVWSYCPHESLVFKLHRQAIRIITSLSYKQDCRNEFKPYKILTLSPIFILQCLGHVKQNSSRYVAYEQIHQYETRHRHKLIAEFDRLTKTSDGKIITQYVSLTIDQFMRWL